MSPSSFNEDTEIGQPPRPPEVQPSRPPEVPASRPPEVQAARRSIQAHAVDEPREVGSGDTDVDVGPSVGVAIGAGFGASVHAVSGAVAAVDADTETPATEHLKCDSFDESSKLRRQPARRGLMARSLTMPASTTSAAHCGLKQTRKET